MDVGPNENETRFRFGKNWQAFARYIDEDRIREAEASLRALLKIDRLDGMTVLDAGCGSGLFSLAALRLGAQKVVSFDYDLDSVACTQHLKNRYGSPFDWRIERGSVLDREWMTALGKFDIVYSWGVLHHTGSMWNAIEIVCDAVATNGLLAIAIYNDQGPISRLWASVKHFYNRLPRPLKFVMGNSYFVITSIRGFITDLLMRRSPLARYRGKKRRGMSAYHDAIDWIGGWPFETAKPEAIFEFCRMRGFTLEQLFTRQGPGCNEFLFSHTSMP